MKKLMERLSSSIRENPAVEIKKSLFWYLPLMEYEVEFKRLKRSQMDILMKMMLLTIDEAEIRRGANLAELLLVEELFIEDLLRKMQRMGLIRMENQCFKLTSKGDEQLNTGILMEEMEEEDTTLSYSPFHDEFWPELTESMPEINEECQPFRYRNEAHLVNEEKVMTFLAEKYSPLEEDGFQTVVCEVLSFDQQEMVKVPCVEFQLYNKEQDIFYSRVWNTGLKRWDDRLEKKIEEHEQVAWREEHIG